MTSQSDQQQIPKNMSIILKIVGYPPYSIIVNNRTTMEQIKLHIQNNFGLESQSLIFKFKKRDQSLWGNHNKQKKSQKNTNSQKESYILLQNHSTIENIGITGGQSIKIGYQEEQYSEVTSSQNTLKNIKKLTPIPQKDKKQDIHKLNKKMQKLSSELLIIKTKQSQDYEKLKKLQQLIDDPKFFEVIKVCQSDPSCIPALMEVISKQFKSYEDLICNSKELFVRLVFNRNLNKNKVLEHNIQSNLQSNKIQKLYFERSVQRITNVTGISRQQAVKRLLMTEKGGMFDENTVLKYTLY